MLFTTLLVALLPLTTFALPTEHPLHFEDPLANALIKRKIRPPGIYGPAIDANFPDPCILKVNTTWWSFATRTIGSDLHIQVASSPNFSQWTLQDGVDALPTLPPWVNSTASNTWAPDVAQLDDGRFIMYFSATTRANPNRHCVGAAYSDTVQGPYTPQETPLYCPFRRGGTIDPAGFRDPKTGARYVLYKVDGNSIGSGGGRCGNSNAPSTPTPIEIVPVGVDGVTRLGPTRTLLDNAGAADEGVVEAPSMIRSAQGVYFLFFSSGCFGGPRYTVSYATSNSPLGPFTRAAQPLIRTGDGPNLLAPGGADMWLDGKRMVFHAGSAARVMRKMWTAIVRISGTTVSLSPAS